MIKVSNGKITLLFSGYAVEYLCELHANYDKIFVFSVGTFVGSLAPSDYITSMSSLFNPGPSGTMAPILESENVDDAIEHVDGFDVVDDMVNISSARFNSAPAMPVNKGDTLYFSIVKSNPHHRKLVHGVEGIRDKHGLAVVSIPVLEYHKAQRQIVVASEPIGGPSLEDVMLAQPSLLDLVTIQKLFVWQVPHVFRCSA